MGSENKMTNVNPLSKNNTYVEINDPKKNIFLGLLLEVIIVFIVIENLLVLCIIRLYKKVRIFDLLILSLSLSDFVNGLLPLQIINIKRNFVATLWSRSLCGSFIWMTYTLRLASLCTVSLMSMEKAFLLYNPLRYYTQFTFSLTRKLVVLAWLISTVLATLPAAFTKMTPYKSKVYCRHLPYEFGLGFGILIEVIGLFHFIFVLCSYIAMLISTRKFRKRQKTMLRDQNIDGRRQNTTENKTKTITETKGMLQATKLCKVMGYIVIVYYITWLPFLIYNLCNLLRPKVEYNHRMGVIVGTISLAAPLVCPLLCLKRLKRYKKAVLYLMGRVKTLASTKQSLHDVRQGRKNSNTTGEERSRAATISCELEEIPKSSI